MKENSWDIDYMEWMFFKKTNRFEYSLRKTHWVSFSLPVTLKYSGMERKPTWTEVLDMWLQDLTDSYLSKMDVAVSTKSPTKSVWSTCVVKEAGMGLKSCWQGLFYFISQPDDCLESCRVTAGWRILGIGKIFLLNFLVLCTNDLPWSILSWLILWNLVLGFFWTVGVMILCYFCLLTGVWLCFICCPLQGGSNLQPTHEPVNPKHVLFELKP